MFLEYFRAGAHNLIEVRVCKTAETAIILRPSLNTNAYHTIVAINEPKIQYINMIN
jgi:hypothetical protein